MVFMENSNFINPPNQNPANQNLPPSSQNGSNENLFDQSLPVEIILKIFSHLENEELQSNTNVSQYWKNLTVDAAKISEFYKIKEFASCIAHSLPECYHSQKKSLLELTDNKFVGIFNLTQLKFSIESAKSNFIKILTEIEDKDLANLENDLDSIPPLFEDVINLAKIHRKIEQTKLMNGSEKLESAQKILNECQAKGYKKLGIETAKSFNLEQSLRAWVENDVKEGNLSFEIVEMIASPFQKDLALLSIAKYYLENNDLEKCLKVIKKISDMEQARFILSDLIKLSLDKDDENGALDFFKLIPAYKEVKESSAMMILEFYSQKGEITKFIQFTKNMPNYAKEIRNSSDLKILNKTVLQGLLQDNNIDSALKLIHVILPEFKDEAYLDMIKILAEKGEFDLAQKMSMHTSLKNTAYVHIAVELFLRGKVDKAKKLIKKIDIPAAQDSCFRQICKKLIEQQKFDLALKVAKKIKEPSLKDDTIRLISQQMT